MVKRVGRLFLKIASWENLREATGKALRSKRSRFTARHFMANLDQEIERLHQELLSGTIRVGQFHQFTIHDPKRRTITAPCFRERVLHHAIMNLCEPVLDRALIDQTYACRKGKGKFAALKQAQQYASIYPFYLKLDIRKYFDNINHTVLLKLLQTKFKDKYLLELFTKIIASYQTSVGTGLAIGSLISQHCANFYLNRLDRFCQESPTCGGYVRYMDDIVLWGQASAALHLLQQRLEDMAAREYHLQFRVKFCQRSKQGLNWLGCRLFPTYQTLNRPSRHRIRTKYYDLLCRYQEKKLSDLHFQQRLSALFSFSQNPLVCSWHFRQSLLNRETVGTSKVRTG